MKLRLLLCVAVLAAMFTVQGAFAAADVCVAVPVGATTPYSATIGVASNFFEPAKIMLNNFQNDPTGTGTTFLLCHNSTTALEANISNYAMLFAADDSAYDYSAFAEGTTYEAFDYARGVPVIFAPKTASGTMSTPAGLISGLTATELSNSSTNNGPGGWSGYSVAGTSSTGLIGTAASVAIAGPDAPYGQAAYKILNNMMATSLPGTLPTTPTSWIFTPLPDNISLTFNAVTTNSVDVNGDGINENTSSVQAGFVGMSQICTPGPLANYVYVAFTNDEYTLAQSAAITSAVPSTALTTVESLYTFIKTKMNDLTPTGWNAFLAANCYQNP
jgi:hypothetical protein